MTVTLKAYFLALLYLLFAASSPAQEIGYSYLRITVNGHPATNIVSDKKHQGWVQVLSVQATLNSAPKHFPGMAMRASAVAIRTREDGKTSSSLPKSGRRGPGKISFTAGDDGGLDPLLQAQKQKIKIANAELDLYSEDTNRFIGRLELRGVRVLSLADVPASACPEFLVTLSFESIASEK